MALSPDTRERIEALLNSNHVVLFMKGTREMPQCGFSAQTTGVLDQLVPDYATVNVLEDQDIREGIKEYGSWPTIPQLYVDGELIGGSDIVTEMFGNGELFETLGMERPTAAPPEIHISERAASAIRDALERQPGAALWLSVDAKWQGGLALSPATAGGIETEAAGLKVMTDPMSAQRADGVRVDLVDTLHGPSFEFDIPQAPPPVKQMSVADLKARLDAGKTVHLFDVRGPDERALASIDAARPLDQESTKLIEGLPREAELIFHCHTGGRSQAAAEHYRRQGFTNVHSLDGGIQAWSELDPGVPQY